MNLSGAGVRILLMGTATHSGPTLTSTPAVARTLEALRLRLVQRCGVDPDNIQVLLDPLDARTMATAVAEEVRRAQSVLLMYYIGHGLLDTRSALYLAASTTDRLTPGLAAHEALSFNAVRDAVSTTRASSVAVILDCCFSGRADLTGRELETTFALPPAHGMYLLASAEHLALAPEEAIYTTFTGELIELLDEGDPRGPSMLTLDAAYDYVFRKLLASNKPIPRRQAGDRSGDLVLTRNQAQPDVVESSTDEPPSAGRCPYPGLAAFGVDDAAFFRGRDDAVAELLRRSARSLSEGCPVVVVGPSGAGKTSLLHAGLLAGLHRGTPDLQDAPGWPQLVLTPGADPLGRLAARLRPKAATEATSLREDPSAAVEMVRVALADRPGDRLVLIVDQFEELFTQCDDESERSAFVQALTAISGRVDDEPLRVLVVVAIRADFYGHATAYPELATALRNNQLLLRPMSADELRAATEKPVAEAGLRLDEGLVDVILHELGATRPSGPEAGALPLLSHSLWSTWRRRVGNRLTFAGYRASGGIRKAIATTADETYAALNPAEQRAIRRMLPQLARVDDEAADTARSVDRVALLSGMPDADAAEHALRRFADARLITLDHETVRISHEALLYAWPLLAGWLEADRDWLRIHQQLTVDASGWQEARHDPALLYRGSRLIVAQSAQESTGWEFESSITEFLDAGQRQERRATRIRTTAIVVLSVLLLVAIVASVGALIFQRQAVDQRNQALARLMVTEAEQVRDSQPGLAKQLSLLAYRIDPEIGSGAVFASQQTPGLLNGQERAIDMSQSRDGSVLAVSTAAAVVLRAGAGPVLGRLEAPSVRQITLSSDGQFLAAATGNGEDRSTRRIRAWNITNVSRPRELPIEPTVTPLVTALAMNSDGRLLAAGTDSGVVLRWNLTALEKPRLLDTFQAHDRAIHSLAFVPSSDLLASSGADHKLKVWNLAGATSAAPLSIMEQPHKEPDRGDPVVSHLIAISPDARWLAATLTTAEEASDRITLWDISAPHNPRRLPLPPRPPFTGCVGRPVAIAFSLTGSHLSESCASNIQLWRFLKDDGKLINAASLPAGNAGTGSSAGVALFSNDNRLLHASPQGVRLWSVSNVNIWEPGSLASLPSAPAGFTVALAFNPTGRRLLAGAGANYAVVWDITDVRQSQLVMLKSRGNLDGGAAAFSPDGTTLALTESDNDNVVLRLRRTSDPAGEPISTIADFDIAAKAVAFSPDNRLLALIDNSDFVSARTTGPSVKLYDVQDKSHPKQIASQDGTFYNISFSPNSRLLAATGADTLSTWTLTDTSRLSDRRTYELTPHSAVSDLAFRSDSRLLATGDSSGTLRLWRINQDQLEQTPTVVRSQGKSTLAYSPDGRTIAWPAKDANLDELLELWDVKDTGIPIRKATVGFSDDIQSIAFSPDGELLASVSDRAITLWDTNSARAATSLCESVGDPMTPEQWARYVPGLPYEPPC